MKSLLHLTNGDSTVASLARAGLPSEIVAWRDVLHEGPVPAGLTLDELRVVRARFIAESGWGEEQRVRAEFAARDAALAGSREHDETVLWFEHDLYDQLQLIQILDWFAEHVTEPGELSLICIDRFAGVEPFHGLGQLSPEQLASLFPRRRAVTVGDLRTGRRAWEAFRSPEPGALLEIVAESTPGLPFLAPALIRHLEEFPWTTDGLSRTERHAMQAVAGGARHPREIFRAYQPLDEPRFMGDATFFGYLARLTRVAAPLLRRGDGRPFLLPHECGDGERFDEQPLELTEAGAVVLRGEADHVALNGVDRWLGGVCLSGATAAWRWDAGTRQLTGSYWRA